MKKIILQIMVCAITFVLSLFIVGRFMNKGNTDMTAEMAKATLPLIYMSQEGDRVNCLHGYLSEMQGSSMRETITPLDNGRNLSVVIEKKGCSIRNISFEVRSVDGGRLVEATDVFSYEEDEEEIKANFTIKDLIDQNTEYNLILLVEDESGRTIRYYTRIIEAEDYHTAEKLFFVKDFHNKTFDKKAAESLTKYLESNSEGDNSTFSHVDIHSSFQQITWGNLNVQEAQEPVYYIREIGPSTATVNVSYMVQIGAGKNRNLYHVEEYYRIRYTKERIYLLSFYRDMDQIFEYEKDGAFANNKIVLGITDFDVEMVESDGGNVFAFVNENRLFCYNISNNRFVYLFGFYDQDNMDMRTMYDAHNIKILSVDETENVQFLVYGYMNRGRHEGEVGIQVSYYNSMLNTIEEEIFIPDRRAYDYVKNDVERLAYLDNNNHLYILLGENVYDINLESKDYSVVADDLKEDSYKISQSNHVIVWKNNEADNELTMLNFSNKKRTEIRQGKNILLTPLGFMGEDLIYGMARVSDTLRDTSGKVVIPMYEIRIQDENGDVLKQYRHENYYVIGAEIKDNQINFSRIRKDEEGQYIIAEDDQIMNNEEKEKGDNTIDLAATEEYETIVQIAVKKTIEKKGMKFLTPKEVLFEGGREIHIEPREISTEHYYVYGIRGMEGIYTKESSAVTHAADVYGFVINDRGSYVWQAGNRSLKNQIMKIEGDLADEERGSLAVCLDTILAYEGAPRNTVYMLRNGQSAVEILKNNLPEAEILELSGCSLNSVLYYVNRDIPVLAMLNDGNAVLIVGFNELNTVLMNPLTGEVYKMGMNDSTELFEENGNGFITYIR